MADDFWNTTHWHNLPNDTFDGHFDIPSEHDTRLPHVFSNEHSSREPTVRVGEAISLGNELQRHEQNEAAGDVLASSTLDLPDDWWRLSDYQSTSYATEHQDHVQGDGSVKSENAETQLTSLIDRAACLLQYPRQDQAGPVPRNEGILSKIILEATGSFDASRDSTERKPETTIDHSSSETSDGAPDDSDTMIGSFHHNGRFKCLQPSCVHKSFKRQAELRRHYDTIHAAQKPQFWCRVDSCQRSRASGGHPFPRRDKRRDHMRKVHRRS